MPATRAGVMRTGQLLARLDLSTPPLALRQFVVIFSESWSTEARVAYNAACLAENGERRAAIITKETREVVKLTDESVIAVIEIEEWADGPA